MESSWATEKIRKYGRVIYIMAETHFEGNKITIGNSTKEFDEKIDKILQTDEVILVLFSRGEMDPQNVVALDNTGAVLWRIEPAKKSESDTPHRYHDMRSAEEKIILRDYDMHQYKLDIETGEVDHMGWRR